MPFLDFRIVWLALMCVPMAVDGGIQRITRYRSTNTKRLITGILYGFGFLGILISIIKFII